MSALTTTLGVLTGASGVTSLVSTRISPVYAEQNVAAPYVTIGTLSVDPLNHLNGCDLDECRVIVTAWAATHASAEAIGDACRAAMVAAGHVCESRADDQFSNDPNPGLFSVEHQFVLWL